MKRLFLILFVIGSIATTTTSCRENNDSAGDEIEEAADDTGDAIDDAADDVEDAADDATD